jgi:Tfp pilus assembly protein PilF
MLRGWLALFAVLACIGVSFAADSNSSLFNDKRWEEARKSLAEGRAAEAKATFEELVKQYPEAADLHLFLGITLLRLREPQGAEAAVRKAITINPNHAEARTLLGWIDSEIRGDLEAAIKEYAKVVELRPDLPEAYNNLGVAQKRKGDLAKAADSFNQALKLKPDYTAAVSNRGWVFAEQNQWDDARREFEKALTINPNDDGALYGLSQALREARVPGRAESVGPADRPIAEFCLLAGMGADRTHSLLLGIALACDSLIFERSFQESEERI